MTLLLQAGAMLGDAFLHQLPHAFGMVKYENRYHLIALDQCLLIYRQSEEVYHLL